LKKPKPELEGADAPAIAALLVGAMALCGCGHPVEIEPPVKGRALSGEELREMQRVADATFREVRGQLEGLPARLTLIVSWDKNVIPETGEGGAAGYPGNIGWRMDPDRDALAIIRTQLRPTLAHELHHLARASRVRTVTLRDRVVSEGLATAFERDFAKVDPRAPDPEWGKPPPLDWIGEVLALPPDAPVDDWIIRHPDGRRWIGMRVGTALVDRTHKAPAALVFASTDEILNAR
jgi:hypothetical protein